MPSILANDLTERWVERVLTPAVNTLSRGGPVFTEKKASRAGELEGTPRLAADDLAAVFEKSGAKRPRIARFLEAGRAYVRDHANAAAGPDGWIRSPNGLPESLRADFAALAGEAQPEPSPRYSWSERVLARVMREHGLADSAALIAAAIALDDGNHYLNTSELERAAATLGPIAEELGLISDLDRTIIPHAREGLPAHAFPGVAVLMRELEGARPGDSYYVTARSPDRVTDLPAWLAEHGLPEGPISTGVSTVPWTAEREKVRDIEEILAANPGQKFILFGDTAHRDPEVYRQVIRLHPDRITAAIINKVNNINPQRVEGLELVDHYAQAAAILYRMGIFDEARARRVMNAAKDEGLAITAAEIDRLIETHRPA